MKKGDKFNNKKTLKIEDIDKIKNDNIKFQKDLEIKLEYIKDKRTILYEDIVNYLKCKEKTGHGIYPNYIYKISDKKGKKNKKKDFKNALHDYFIDKTSGRVKIRFNQSNVKSKQYKEYYISYQFEKNQVKPQFKQIISKAQEKDLLLI